jgi:hypothetical protein
MVGSEYPCRSDTILVNSRISKRKRKWRENFKNCFFRAGACTRWKLNLVTDKYPRYFYLRSFVISINVVEKWLGEKC